MTDANLSYQSFGSDRTFIAIPKLSIVGRSTKTEILAQAKYANYQLEMKGKTGNLHDALDDWSTNSVKMPIDLSLMVNGKVLNINGQIDKKPKSLPTFDLHLSSKSFELGPLAGSAALAGSGGKQVAGSNSNQAQRKFLFGEDALPFNVLPQANGKLAINIDELSFPGHVPMTAVKGNVVFDGSNFHVNDLSFGLGKGSALYSF